MSREYEQDKSNTFKAADDTHRTNQPNNGNVDKDLLLKEGLPESMIKIPLESNNSSVLILNEHVGEIVHSKWNPSKQVLATGGNSDCFVDLWDTKDTLNSTQAQQTANHLQSLQPFKQLRHISVDSESMNPKADRSDENHYISSIQWSNFGDRLLTSAYDNIARVWNLEGKLQGLFNSQNSLIFSCWNKSDTLVASGGDETNVLIWNPNTIQKEPIYQFNQPGQIIDIAWQNDKNLAAASSSEIYLWTIDTPKSPVRVWQAHQTCIENIKWDQKGHLLASSAQDDSQIFIWSPKQSTHILSINEHEGAIRDFKWSNQDPSNNSGGIGFIITLSKDQTVKVFNISKSSAECMITFRHESQITSLALSPDNQILAVGGQNSDIYIWSLKNQKLIRSFGSNALEKGQDELMANQEKEPIEIIDINWSNDGTMLAAGFEKSLVLLDMRKILSTPVEHLLMQINQQQDLSVGDHTHQFGYQRNAVVKNQNAKGQVNKPYKEVAVDQKHGQNQPQMGRNQNKGNSSMSININGAQNSQQNIIGNDQNSKIKDERRA